MPGREGRYSSLAGCAAMSLRSHRTRVQLKYEITVNQSLVAPGCQASHPKTTGSENS